MADAVRRIETTAPHVYAFEIDGAVSAEEMHAMGGVMNDAFDAHEGKVNLMLIFRRFDGSETGAGLDFEAITSRLRSVTHVGRYIVVGAPDGAATMVETMGKLMPVEAMTFPLEALDDAWAAAGARPKPKAG